VPRGRDHTLPRGTPLWGGYPVSSQTRHVVYDALPVVFPEILPGDQGAGLGLPPVSAHAKTEIDELLVSPDFDAWSQALSRVGNCAHPIRLHGSSVTVDRATGEVVASYSSSQEPLGVTTSGAGTAALPSVRRVRGCTPPTCFT
jgi:hypothetical protein